MVVGPVFFAAGRGPGWFGATVVLPEDLDRLDQAVLEDRDTGKGYRVLDVIIEDEAVFLRVQPAAPEDGLVLNLPRLDPAARYRDLLFRLDGPAAVKVVQPFARGVLDRLSPSEAGLDPHDRAVSATQTAGLHAVWAPPSSGSTEVITEAIGTAMDAGRRCLLVSPDAAALDAILNRLAQARRPRAGEVIRVGPARSPQLATNDAIMLSALSRAQQPELSRQIDQQHQRVLEIREAGPRLAVREARRRLVGFDPADHRVRSERLRTANRMGELVEVSGVAEAEAAGHRQRLNEIDAELGSRAESRQKDILIEAEAEEAAARHRLESESVKLTNWRRRRRAVSALRLAEQRAENERGTLAAVRAGTADRISLIDSGDPLVSERRAVREADDATRSRLGELRVERDRLTALPQPEPADAAVCRAADEAGLPELAAALPELIEAARAADEQLSRAGDELAALIEQQQAAAPAIEAGLLDRASLTATTLAELMRSRSLTRRRYALVVLDQAAAALLPEVVFAAAQAARTCVLVGDFLQQGPVVAVEHVEDHYWDHDVFEHFGLTSARAAQHHPGCVLLDGPSRFGSIITDYLNAIAYQGVLERGAPDRRSEDPELIWVDVDGLPARLTTISSSSDEQQDAERSWPAGASLAVAIAEQHHDLGQTVGVITPYQRQAGLIRAAVDEAGLIGQVFVGTPAQVQTRTFDVVVFDTVEDGRGWIARARRDAVGPSADWCRDGLRVIDVALTRAEASVYLIASGRALRGDRGTPMGELVQLCASGAVPRLSARRVLAPVDPTEPSSPTEPSAPADLGIQDQGDRAVVDQ